MSFVLGKKEITNKVAFGTYAMYGTFRYENDIFMKLTAHSAIYIFATYRSTRGFGWDDEIIPVTIRCEVEDK